VPGHERAHSAGKARVRPGRRPPGEAKAGLVRPLPGLATLFATLPPRVSVRRRGRVRGTLATCLALPLAFAVRAADRLVPSFL